jgi:diacylglycerol kinase family enzyme
MSSSEQRVAVLLNPNAKRVSQAVQGAIANVMSPDDLFISRSESDARSIARTVVARGYDTVFTGGGDGTFMGFLNKICDCLGSTRLPRFGILRLGTGNALASLVGASPARGGGMIDDLVRTRSGQIGGVYELELVEAEGVRSPFAGLGVDGHLINAYAEVKANYRKILGRWAEGGFGYALAVATKTLPYYCVTHRKLPEVEVINSGSTAFRLDSSGQPVGRAIEYGEVLYRGPARIVAGGTLPNFGFDFRFFPFAGRRRGKMHLRIFAGSFLGVLTHLRKTFRGEYFPEGTFDYFCDSVRIRSDQPMPYELGGDPKGTRTELDLGMADRRVQLVSFRGAARAAA